MGHSCFWKGHVKSSAFPESLGSLPSTQHGVSEPSLTPVSREPNDPFCLPWVLQVHGAYTCMQENTHTHIIKIFFKTEVSPGMEVKP